MKPPKDLEKMRRELGGARNLAKHYGVGERRVRSWFIEKGMPIKPATRIAPPPKDFREKYKNMSRDELQKHYNVGRKSISTWVKELGLKTKNTPPPPKNKRPVPDGFKAVSPTMTMNELCAHYGAACSTIRRWIAETGLPKRRWVNFGTPKAQPIPPAKDDHEHHRAVNYLRKFMAVSPCDEQGKYQENGSHYRIGYSVFTHQEVIDRAQSHQERAMRKIFSSSKAA